MTLIRRDPELERPIEDPVQLIDFFRAGEKPASRFRVGTEHEKIGLYSDTLGPIPYEGERGIGALLQALLREHPFEALLDGETLVGLAAEGATITLEPGGQLELSGAPLASLHETCREFRQHVALLKQTSERFGIVWLGLGIHPLAKLDELPRMPRVRHDLMREHLSRRGELALVMMHATGTVQANFDYASQADAAAKLRMALAASPVVTALYANSSVSQGEKNGFESLRAWVWRHTDADRCGLLPFVFSDGWGPETAYAAYAEWALDVPLMFIEREGVYVRMASPFREYLDAGYDGRPATLADWNLHLTTLFPEVRMKRVIEVRGADAVPPDLVCALPAFWKGLFYDPASLAAASERLAHWTFADVDRLHAAVAREGLSAHGPDGPVLEVARELVVLAGQGLRAVGATNATGEDERLFLEPLHAILDRGESPARTLLRRWDGAFRQRMDRLVEYARY